MLLLRCVPFLLVWFLAGCWSASDPMDEYLIRLERVTQIGDISKIDPVSLKPPLLNKTLIIEQTESVGLLDSLDLDRCGILSILAEANAPMGKAQVGPPRLERELRLFRVTQGCRMLEKSNLMIEKMDQVRYHQWPVRYWNILLETREVARLYGGAGYSGELDLPMDLALQLFVQADQDPVAVNQRNIYPSFKRIGQFAGAKFWRQLIRYSRQLEVATAHLKQFSDLGGCRNPFRRQQVERMQGLLYRYYIPEVQSVLAKRGNTADELRRFWLALLDTRRDVVPGEFSRYLDQLVGGQGEVLRFRRANIQHAEAWNALLAKCDMSPGKISQNQQSEG